MRARAADLRLRAQADWLVCHDVCIPESATLELLLPVVAADTTPGATAWTALFERAAAARAQPLKGWTADLQRSGRDAAADAGIRRAARRRCAAAGGGGVPLHRAVDRAGRPRAVRHAARLCAAACACWPTPQAAGRTEGRGRGPGRQHARSGAAPARWSSSARRCARCRASCCPKARAPSRRQRRRPPRRRPRAALGTSLWLALLLAFVGGMVLNLMPCVFPVLSIKLLSLAQQASRAGRAARPCAGLRRRRAVELPGAGRWR